jgi:LVIVD repeat
MRRLVLFLVAAALLALAGSATASHKPLGRAVSDAPSAGPGSPLLEAGGYSHVDRFRGQSGSVSRDSDDRVRLVSALPLNPPNVAAHGDVAGYKDLAFIGKWREECPGTGVDIIDISRSRRPVKIADTRDYADTSMEDMQAIRIGRRDILAIGLQDCGNSATAGTVGLELYDITNPRNPQFLTIFNGEDIPGLMADHGHVHEFDLVKRRNGQVLAALASPDSEVITSDAQFRNGIGDALLVDITNPSAPTLVGEYGVLDDPMFGVPFYVSVLQGGDARTLQPQGDAALSVLLGRRRDHPRRPRPGEPLRDRPDRVPTGRGGERPLDRHRR